MWESLPESLSASALVWSSIRLCSATIFRASATRAKFAVYNNIPVLQVSSTCVLDEDDHDGGGVPDALLGQGEVHVEDAAAGDEFDPVLGLGHETRHHLAQRRPAAAQRDVHCLLPTPQLNTELS